MPPGVTDYATFMLPTVTGNFPLEPLEGVLERVLALTKGKTMKTLLLTSLFLTLGFARIAMANAEHGQKLDCKGGDIILPECQMEDLIGQVETNPLFSAAKAEALRRLELNSDFHSAAYIIKPHCSRAKSSLYDNQRDGKTELRTQLKCESSFSHKVYGEAKPVIVNQTVSLTIESAIENVYEWYEVKILRISVAEQWK